MSPTRSDDWIDDDEYPDERDIDDFGDESPGDNDPLTIGRVGNINRRHFWTLGRVTLLIIVLIVIASLLLPQLSSLLR